jgi:hypothetical protein
MNCSIFSNNVRGKLPLVLSLSEGLGRSCTNLAKALSAYAHMLRNIMCAQQ